MNANQKKMKADDLKLIVKDKYSQIAHKSNVLSESKCCGTTGCCSRVDYSVFSENYAKLSGYNPDADLGLGCGIPTEFAGIKQGNSVLDLGSGAGNDSFVARAIVGETGKVTGLDFTDAMLQKARENIRKLGFTNVEFVQGDIEDMPLPDNSYDVVLSNCVLNLVPDKAKAFAQIMRVLKTTGQFCVSDVVIKGNLPDVLRKDAEMYAGCVSGAIDIDEYLDIISKQGFKNITVHKLKEISIPIELLSNTMTQEEIAGFQKGETGIFSVTVSAYKE
ncbi:MAG: arsenite methyltransferase [Bacteroidales bacterium]|nr:arsenite methyltransferase [Bacteroidales bacterium]